MPSRHRRLFGRETDMSPRHRLRPNSRRYLDRRRSSSRSPIAQKFRQRSRDFLPMTSRTNSRPVKICPDQARRATLRRTAEHLSEFPFRHRLHDRLRQAPHRRTDQPKIGDVGPKRIPFAPWYLPQRAPDHIPNVGPVGQGGLLMKKEAKVVKLLWYSRGAHRPTRGL